MNIKIQPGRIKYYTYGTNTVTAVLKGCSENLIDYVWDTMMLSKRDLEALRLNNEYSGVAVCAEGDTFDLEVGKEIARRKAVKKYREAILNNYSKWLHGKVKQMNQMTRGINADTEFCQNKYVDTMKKYSAKEN